MDRILEPELMDDAARAAAYAGADFAKSNQAFVDGLAGALPARFATVLDIGCGPADVDIRLARAVPGAVITAVDGSASMIALARDAVRAAALGERITLRQATIPGLAFPPHGFDAVVAKDLLHHLPDPAVLWTEALRVGRPGGLVYVMDLIRPDTPADAERIVTAVSGGEDPLLQEDFFNSLCAAFTPSEVRDQLETAGLAFTVQPVNDRHMLIRGMLPDLETSRG